MTDAARIGARIRELRNQQGATLTDLATRAEVSKSYLSTVENGTGARPGAAILHKIAVALGVTLADLLGRVVVPDEPSEVPQSLRAFAKEAGIPRADVMMLAGIKFRGESPRTVERWRFIYNAIAMSARSEDVP